MATHNDLGRLAEQGAAAWLESKGYTLLASNFRYKHAEIDLIMTHAGLLIFIEVSYILYQNNVKDYKLSVGVMIVIPRVELSDF
jgi:Holliday junction resolvase-like predicted endonuclease